MTHFERDLYENDLPPEEWQARWWQYVSRFQGVQAPKARSEDLCDACTKTHINDDPAQYYDYALASLVKFQLLSTISLFEGPPSRENEGIPDTRSRTL